MPRVTAWFVMYAVIEALVPITNMVVSYVRDRGDIVAIHGRLLANLRARDGEKLQTDLDDLLAYLLERFSEAQGLRDEQIDNSR